MIFLKMILDFAFYNKLNKNTAGTAVNACGGNVKPKTSKKNISKKSRAVSNETRILVL